MYCSPILLAAVAQNGVIGHHNALPWALRHELRHFQQRTRGHTLVCGYTTWASLPTPLTTHGRSMVVLTRHLRDLGDHAVAAKTPAMALKEAAQLTPNQPALIIGGAQVYTALLDVCKTAEISRIQADVEGDTIFPMMGPNWRLDRLGPLVTDRIPWRVEYWSRCLLPLEERLA